MSFPQQQKTRRRLDLLTEREVVILQTLADTFTPAATATALKLARSTVNNCLGQIYIKLEVTGGMVEAILLAARYGVVQIPGLEHRTRPNNRPPRNKEQP